MQTLDETLIPFRTATGEVLAKLRLIATRDAASVEISPLIELSAHEATEYGETARQLKEAERYEYEIINIGEPDRGLRLRCDRSKRRRGMKMKDSPDAGLLETGSFCGTLLLELVEGEATPDKKAVATALIDVRSIKMEYRTHYRGMLRRLSEEMADLVVDCRSSTKAAFRSSFKSRDDRGWLQIQLELLRETIDSKDFAAAIHRILSFPHEKLADGEERVNTERPIRWTPNAIRQLAHGQPRRTLPTDHPLRVKAGMESIAGAITVPRRIRDLDTPENRFIKFALEDIRSFLSHAEGVFSANNGWQASAALAKRLSSTLDDWLGRAMFREIGPMRYAPLGSPVLQRKAGYREILRWWLRFHTAAELSWEGGEDLFQAGQRNVAELYEYWLFFELLQWFCQTCREGKNPPIDDLIEGFESGKPNFKLRKSYELGPFKGFFAGMNRSLNVRFSYNRRFKVTKQRSLSGSWTRNMHPDYTLSFWPEGYREKEAEENEQLVHVHFDAKYRVGNIASLFGNEDDDDCDLPIDEQVEADSNYKHQDLLKMHAYRDAIKRSQGAYVLYPGLNLKREVMQGFHEILPGLGAFAIAPDKNGKAVGLGDLEAFLQSVLEHVGNRTTVMERVNYHVAQANELDDIGELKEKFVKYGTTHLPERDQFDSSKSALHPSEHKVLVVWSKDDDELVTWKDNKIAFVRLGKRAGSLNISSELFGVRHLLVRRKEKVFDGLKRFTKDGFYILTGKDLNDKYKLTKDESHIYAVFHIEEDPDFFKTKWDEGNIWKKISSKYQEANPKAKPLNPRRSADPVVISLKDLIR
jgi:predicted component of viral defense system (DUF524 family)